jgi:hypothetical protein
VYHRIDDPEATDPLWWLLSDGDRGREVWPDVAGWQVLVDYAEANGLGSVLARKVTSSSIDIPESIRRRLVQLDEKLGWQTDRAVSQARSVDAALRSRGIMFYWLKGAAWGSSLYEGVGVRPMRDLDFIVRRDDLEQATSVLAGLGYATDPGASAASQHLPRMVHDSSKTKIDLHHRVVPSSIYGFPVSELTIPWEDSHGLVDGDPGLADARFHLAHMIVHAFHHSFYNLRAMHLYDIKLALSAWDVPVQMVIDAASTVMPHRIVLDILSLTAALAGGISDLDDNVNRWTVTGLIRNGSLPLGYPLTRIEHVKDAPRVIEHEARRAWFVLRRCPDRFGRPPAALHPPGADD